MGRKGQRTALEAEKQVGRTKRNAYLLLKECSLGEITETKVTYLDIGFDRKSLDLPMTTCSLPGWLVLAPVQSFESGNQIIYRYRKEDIEGIEGVKDLSERSLSEVARLISNTFDFIHKSGYLVLNFDPNMAVSEDRVHGTLRLMLPALTTVSKPSALLLRGMQPYVAPEVFSNREGALGTQSDVFSIGAYLLSQAIGKSSFRSHKDVQIYSKRSRTLNRRISPYMADLMVRSTLISEIEMRPQTATEFQMDLRTVESDEFADYSGTWNHCYMEVECGSHSVIGRTKRKQVNEDSFFHASKLEVSILAVADGVSTADLGNGKTASQIMIRTLQQVWDDYSSEMHGKGPQRVDECGREMLMHTLNLANRRIAIESSMLLEGEPTREFKHPMTTTFCGAVYGCGRAIISNIGDSRAYLVRDKRIILLTQDDDRVADYLKQHMAWEEIKAKEDYRSLTGVVGRVSSEAAPLPFSSDDVHFYGLSMKPEDIIILCSDGLIDYSIGETEYQRERSVFSICHSGKSAEAIAKEMVSAADEHGGGDNITAVVLRCKEEMR